jgi:hypothetical protein
MVSFYEEAVTPACLKALRYVRQHNFIADFYLGGGTALVLQIGHRVSTDLEWYSTTDPLLTPKRETISLALGKSDQFEVTSEQDGKLYTRLFEVDVNFTHEHHPLLEPSVEYVDVQLASPTDIGLMKLAAINSGGTRRDFVDLFCLRGVVTLNQLLDLATIKYADRSNFLTVSARALTCFEEAEQQPMPDMLVPVNWSEVRAYCETAARWLERKLNELD